MQERFCSRQKIDAACQDREAGRRRGAVDDEAPATPLCAAEGTRRRTSTASTTASSSDDVDTIPLVQRPDSEVRSRLVTALARVLAQLASLGRKPQVATGFHAVRPSPLSIHEYLERIANFYVCSDECLVLGLVYIDRLMKLQPQFVVSPLSIHRLLATSMMVAAKFFDDSFFVNSYYARVAGVRVQELNDLEVQFLQFLNWKLFVHPEEFQIYRGHVLSALKGASPAPSPEAPPVQSPSAATPSSVRVPPQALSSSSEDTQPCAETPNFIAPDSEDKPAAEGPADDRPLAEQPAKASEV